MPLPRRPGFAQALDIQNIAAPPLLEPRLKATLCVHRSSSVARRDAQPAEQQEHRSELSLAENRQDWDKRRQEAQHSKLTQAEKRQKQKKLRGDMASQKHCPTPTHRDPAAVLRT